MGKLLAFVHLALDRMQGKVSRSTYSIDMYSSTCSRRTSQAEWGGSLNSTISALATPSIKFI